ncbi:hypothetical protein GCM10027288_54320 [Bordetella tumbae]
MTRGLGPLRGLNPRSTARRRFYTARPGSQTLLFTAAFNICMLDTSSAFVVHLYCEFLSGAKRRAGLLSDG